MLGLLILKLSLKGLALHGKVYYLLFGLLLATTVYSSMYAGAKIKNNTIETKNREHGYTIF